MDKPITLWVVDDDRSIRWVLEKAFKKVGFNVHCFPSAEGILDMLKREQPDVLLTDIRMPGKDGIALLSDIQGGYPNLPVIVMTAHSDMASAVSAYDGGAFEYLPKPFDIDDVVMQVERAYAHTQKPPVIDTSAAKNKDMPDIIGEAPAMQVVFRAIGRLSRSNVTVMVNGESGTGKELVAKALHKYSPRADKAFIALNMAAIPKDLLESELFGHEKGAFTGATSQREGRFKQANGGTLFLDEIGDMPADTQTRLLRVLSDGEFYPVGAVQPTKVDVRIVAATHQSLEELVADGRFREDLFHRLNVVRIRIPPIRDRKEDIPLLLKHFIAASAVELSVETKVLRPEVVDYLSSLSWMGNVRQIENVCRWLTVMCPGNEVHLDDLPKDIVGETPAGETFEGSWMDAAKRNVAELLEKGETGLAKSIIPQIEKILILQALAFTKGRRQEAAKVLGYGRNTLTRKIKELGV